MEEDEFNPKGDLDDVLLVKNKLPKYAIILLIIFPIIILLLAGALIYLLFFKKEKNQSTDNENNGFEFPDVNAFYFFGTKYSNLSYAEDGIITNTFKSDGENYNSEIGNINNGKNYEANELNTYDLYISRYAEQRKNETTGIMLWIHGGYWIGGDLSMTSPYCELFTKFGYISANMNYTLLIDKYKEFNIFRILDEITAAIKAIKKELVNRGFHEDKLVLGIGGVSAGGHLSLLYSYLIKNISIIPIKFVINVVGPVGLHEKYFYKLKSNNESLPDIEDISILEKAKEEGKIIKALSNSQILFLMNAFWGNRYTQEELDKMLDENGNIIYDNPKYIDMYNFVKYGDITEVEDKHELPTICVYGGSDDVIGVAHYAYLKEKAKRKIDYIYARYEGHIIILTNNDEGIQEIMNMNAKITEYFHDNFS